MSHHHPPRPIYTSPPAYHAGPNTPEYHPRDRHGRFVTLPRTCAPNGPDGHGGFIIRCDAATPRPDYRPR